MHGAARWVDGERVGDRAGEDRGGLRPGARGGERIEKAYQLLRDLFVFTNKRLILVDKQGLTGSKVEHRSLPYRGITHFSVETSGHFDLDAELKVWISGSPIPIQQRFNKQLNIYDVQSVLAGYVPG